MTATFGVQRSHKGKLWRRLDAEGRSDVLVYFSGHGVPGQSDQRGYLLPVDADPDAAELNGYPLDLLYANLAKLKARSVTVILEACFSGDSHKGMLIQAASPVFMRAASTTIPDRITVITAASGVQLASWDEDRRHGLFTDRFLKGVAGSADNNRDGRVTLGEISSYLSRTMTPAARRLFGREQVATVLGNANLVLARLASTSQEPAVTPVQPKVQSPICQHH